MRIRKDDQVEVITGDDKGTATQRRIAKVLRVLPEKNKIVVEGVNRVYKHLKPSAKNQKGGRLSKEMPIDASNVMLFCPTCNRGVRIGHRFTDAGQKQRYCKKCSTSLGQCRPRQARPRQEAAGLIAPRPSETCETRRDERMTRMARLLDQYNTTIAPAMASKFNLTNKMAIPKLEKIVINMGVGRATQDKALLDAAVDGLGRISGQKPLVTKARARSPGSGSARGTRSAARSRSAAAGCTSSSTA